jgi:hypothetical protein|tara:strand:- start:177 stop:680 length:504 start_codon:yes stop_codon:yes gene_type:complete
MAYFADLDSDNRVLQVLIVNDDNITPGDDAANESWCDSNLTHATNGVSWKQTFKDGTRGLYANGDNIIYRTSDWEGHATANKFVGDIPQAWASVFQLDSNNFWVPKIADPAVDDQGRTLPYDPNNVPSDGIAWGFDPDNNRWQGAVHVDGVTTQKYYDPDTQTWSNV